MLTTEAVRPHYMITLPQARAAPVPVTPEVRELMFLSPLVNSLPTTRLH